MISFLLRSIGYLALWVFIAIGGFIAYSFFTQYNPNNTEELPIFSTKKQPISITNDTLNILSWNIGYCGLGSDMDFFMDGGESSRTSRGRTIENLNSVIDFIDKHKNSLDFILLQEVDKPSKRSYNINEYDTLVSRFGQEFMMFFATNFKVSYVPIPLSDPIGQVNAGLVTMSRYTPTSAQRISLPKDNTFIESMFNLKRCMLSLSVPLLGGDTLTIINTHNSAYDDGGLRKAEIEFISDYLAEHSNFIISGDWNSNPPQYTPKSEEINNEFFSPEQLQVNNFSSDYNYLVDSSIPTARYGYEPYKNGSTITTTIDFGLSSPNIKSISSKCIDLGFENSDHNPVIYKVVIQK